MYPLSMIWASLSKVCLNVERSKILCFENSEHEQGGALQTRPGSDTSLSIIPHSESKLKWKYPPQRRHYHHYYGSLTERSPVSPGSHIEKQTAMWDFAGVLPESEKVRSNILRLRWWDGIWIFHLITIITISPHSKYYPWASRENKEIGNIWRDR